MNIGRATAQWILICLQSFIHWGLGFGSNPKLTFYTRIIIYYIIIIIIIICLLNLPLICERNWTEKIENNKNWAKAVQNVFLNKWSKLDRPCLLLGFLVAVDDEKFNEKR